MSPLERKAKQAFAGGGLRPAASISGILLLAFALPALATTVRHLGLGELVASSDTIVQGRVRGVRSFWQGKQILTEVTVGVGRALKGKSASSVTFRQVGGRVSAPVPLEMTVPGAPTFSTGDEGYFFLQPAGGGTRMVVGLFQGHVPLRRDAHGD